MSFYTSLTGLNAATAQLGVTSNNIANVSTTGFKRSRTDFGDIFATSPLQKATATIGQGVSLKRVVQEFGQGNMMFSSNTLDLAISGDGFFPLKSQDGFQDIFTRNGVFMMNDQYNVVNSAGQKLMAASVDSSGKANLDDMNVLTIPQKTTGMAKQTSKVQLGLNFPADAGVITKEFNRNDPETYNKSTALTVYDAGGNSYLATVYYAKTQNASQASPNNKWQTFVYVGDKLVNASLQQATTSTGELMYVNKYGELKAKSDFKTPEEIAELNSSFSKKTIKFSLDDLTDIRTSQPATIVAGLATDLGTGSNDGIDFGNYVNISKSDLLHQQGSSAVTYTMNESVLGSRVITFGPAAARTTVTVPANGSTPATPAEVAAALNTNANFASTYVAQAASPSVVVSGINFGSGSPTINPFSAFNINIGGKQFDLKNLDTSITTPAALATSLQTRLQALDGGRSDITVAYSGTSLTITDAAQRNITGVTMSKTSAASVPSNTASVGADPVYQDPILKITALDPNTSADDINSTTAGVSVMQGSELVAGTKQETPFMRAVADYTLSSTADAFKVTFGTVTAPVTVEGTSGADLVDTLNKDATFSADFIASFSSTDNKLTIESRDPSNASAQSISNSLKIYQNGGVGSTVFGLVGTKTSAEFTGLDETSPTSETAVVTFKDLAPGKSVTVAGLTYTNPSSASSTLTAANVAAKFAAYDRTIATTMVGFSNTLSGFTKTSSATGATLTFTAETSGDVTDIGVSSTDTAAGMQATAVTTDGTATVTQVTVGTQTISANSIPDLLVALQNDTTFSSAFTASATGGTLTITAKDPFSEAGQVLPTVKQKLNSDTSFTAIASSAVVTGNPVLTSGIASDIDISKKSIDDLRNLFTVNVDNAIDPVVVGLDHLLDSMSKLPASQSKKLSGTQIAAELTNVISRAYGDEKPFNFSGMGSPTFKVQLTLADKTARTEIPINLAGAKNMQSEDLVREVQTQIDSYPQYNGWITVSYDTQAQQLVFASKDNAKVTLSSEQSAIGLSDPLVQGVNDQSVGLTMAPSVSTSAYRATNDQRYGMKVEYDTVKQSFVFKSGTTGDNSGIAITGIRPGSLATQSSKGLGMTGDPTSYVITPSTVEALRGITSQPAVLSGNALAVNVDNNFSVDATNNQFVVSVNGITGTVVVPPKDTYTLGTFMEALQSGINNLQGPSKNGLTAESVNGVTVSYNAKTNALEFKTGTASTDSYIKVTGDARWGLDGLDAKFGTTTTWIKPKSFTDEKGATVYIDGFGSETSSAAGFETLPSWSPIYFDKGELTFDTAGNLVSPKQGAQLDTVYLPNGKGALTINIDYSKSTQFASPFSVLSQSQDGAPEGDLVGLAIADDGLVSASFSNGAQKSLGKVVLVNFSNPSGLRQIGDTNYYKTSDSGTPKYGEAGSAGFGTVRSGATERANVDLTQELVDLITEQRNFQANAKAMETSTSMTQTIIQIRN